ncbi:mitochondrial genome maintenance exonuclease 1-like [Sabethes cyaneus]|uniref:mitochondrial genome maintenance exonuclease 1-like n=1 Tax=Sabethes cyaneus TaxID=53552 RepID=UPI00237DD988|nr:mitochondrial genome maintenance exonuclease 1-like [Sabethes cyaneus]
MLRSHQLRYLTTAVKKKTATKSPVKSRVRTIKNLNYENKTLYGAVTKDLTVTNNNSTETSNSAMLSSEMYWLLQKKNVPSKAISLTSTNNNCTQNTVPSKLIPFKDTELKSLPTFPLVPSTTGILESHWTRHQQFENEQYKSPSVNKILTATMPESARQALLKWKASKIALLGEDGFAELQKATFERGINFHSCLESWLSMETPDENKLRKVDKLWTSIDPLLDKIHRPANIIERKVYHPFLHYNGVVDCVSCIDNQLHIIEWKTSEKQKKNLSGTFDAPLQLCAYLGALKAGSAELSELDVTKGAVLVAYTDGKPAHIHSINQTKLKQYWSAWLQRLQEYWIRYRDDNLPEPI